jgi:hypothetical protein
MKLIIERMTRREGDGGCYAYDVDLAYVFAQWSCSPLRLDIRVAFIAGPSGAPMSMVLPSGQCVAINGWYLFADGPNRLDPEWIRRFYAEHVAR